MGNALKITTKNKYEKENTRLKRVHFVTSLSLVGLYVTPYQNTNNTLIRHANIKFTNKHIGSLEL